jgi:hypothetical protein
MCASTRCRIRRFRGGLSRLRDHWKQEHDALDSRARRHGAAILCEHGHRRLLQMQRFYTEIADILGTMADIVQPSIFDERARYGCGDLAGAYAVADDQEA